MKTNKFEESEDTKAKITAGTILYIAIVIFIVIVLIIRIINWFF
jgi:preprotein translocase subunit Sec61beta